MKSNEKSTKIAGELPTPPELPKRFRLPVYRWIAMPVVMVIPLLAILDTFGIKTQTRSHRIDGYELKVTFPERCRYGQDSRLIVVFHNQTAEPLPALTVSLDPGYLSNFEVSNQLPNSQEPFKVDFAEIRVGDSALVTAAISASRSGTYRGEIIASMRSHEPLKIEIVTTIFP